MKSGSLKLRKQAYDFISDNRVGALATIRVDGIPHVVIVYCLVEEDLSIYFSTRVEGRKYENLVHQPNIAMTFYNEKNLTTIQLTGMAERVDDLKREQEVHYNLMKLRNIKINWTLPPMQLFERGATNELAIIKITPSEMTYATFKTSDSGRHKPFFQKII